MLARIETVSIIGTEAHPVQVETKITGGLPTFSIVGLATKSVREAEHRVRAAIAGLEGVSWPTGKIICSLAPGALPKDGSHLDLAIALALLGADERVSMERLDGWVVLGELGLDGRARPVRGVLPAALAASGADRQGLICPSANAPEAALVEGLEIVGVSGLLDCIGFARGEWEPPAVAPNERTGTLSVADMIEVRGHPEAKRAAEIAAAGGHNLLLHGVPGSGKTMLARRIPGIFPEMSREESLEVTRIHSVAGLLPEGSGLVEHRPFRVPHHNISLAGLIGGGSGLARPGEISLAHNGTLFLDELPLYRRDVLESLRGPLEDGTIRIARSKGTVTFPCRFSLVAAMNPCPCGFAGDARRRCRCDDHQVRVYRARFSGPLLDRFDLQVAMDRLTRTELLGSVDGESSVTIRTRVAEARSRQSERYGSGTLTNATVERRVLNEHVHLSSASRALVGDVIDAGRLGGRGLDRVLRVGRTLADLEGCVEVSEEQVALALALRAGDLEEIAAA